MPPQSSSSSSFSWAAWCTENTPCMHLRSLQESVSKVLPPWPWEVVACKLGSVALLSSLPPSSVPSSFPLPSSFLSSSHPSLLPHLFFPSLSSARTPWGYLGGQVCPWVFRVLSETEWSEGGQLQVHNIVQRLPTGVGRWLLTSFSSPFPPSEGGRFLLSTLREEAVALCVTLLSLPCPQRSSFPSSPTQPAPPNQL